MRTLQLCQFLLLFGKVLTFQLIILHTNDVHDRIEEIRPFGGTCSDEDKKDGKCFGGVARRMTAIQDIRNEEDNVLLLDAGDQFQGTLWFKYYGGNITALFMNELKYDAMSFGNHEFDQGTAELGNFLNSVDFPIVCSNLDASQEPLIDGKFVKHLIKEIDGQKIGIVGYLTQKMPYLTLPSIIENLKFLDEIDSVRAEVESLIAQGVNKIIALGHAGFSMDKKIAESVEGIDIVVGGHTDTFLYTGTPPLNMIPDGDYPFVVEQPSGGRVLVVQALTYGIYLGFLNVTFNDQGSLTSWEGNPVLLNSSIPKDPRIQQLVDEMKAPLEGLHNTSVGYSIVTLEGNREACRARECNLGNLITDAMVYSVARLHVNKSEAWTTASIAVTNSGGIRQTLLHGDITMGDLFLVHPFTNTLIVVTLKGKDLKAILEHSVSEYGDSEDLSGGFLQMSGLKVKYDVRRKVGSRVREVKVLCAMCTVPQYEPLNEGRNYKVIVPNFIAVGGDGYSIVKENHLGYQKIDTLLTDAITEYMASNSPISTGLEERIVFVEEREPMPTTCGTAGLAALNSLIAFLLLIYFT